MDHRLITASLAVAFAILFKEASVQIASAGAGNAAPSFAALSASSLPGMFKWPGTQRTRIEPGGRCGRWGRRCHLLATSQNSSKTACEEPVEGARSRIATSRLSKNTHISVAYLAVGASKAAFAPQSAADASASKTSALWPRENALWSILCPC